MPSFIDYQAQGT